MSGEPNNGGGYYPNEDGVIMAGPTYSVPGSWYDGPVDQVNMAVVEVVPEDYITEEVMVGPIVHPCNGHTYYLLSPMSAASAESLAVSLGGHLVTINDAEENAWVLDTFGSYDETLWIGLNDVATEGTWQWLDGTSVSYFNWMSGEPNNGGGYYPYNEDAVVLAGPTYSVPGKWYDGPGNQINAAVIEVAP